MVISALSWHALFMVKRFPDRLARAVFACALAPGVFATAAPSEIQSIGPLSGDVSSEFVSFSPEGHALVGRSKSGTGTETTFVWTTTKGIELAPQGITELGAASTEARFVTGKLGTRPVRWDRSSGEILELPAEFASAVRISGDGRTITGYGVRTGSPVSMVRWKEGGSVSKVEYDGFFRSGSPGPISLDGSVATADIFTSGGESGSSSGFFWDSAGVKHSLEGSAVCGAVTADGQYVYGLDWSYNANGSKLNLVRWRQNGALELLITSLSDSTFRLPVGVDATGSVLAMNRSVSGSPVPSILRLGMGYQSLHDLFAASGIDMNGWSLTSVRAMSSDGYWFAGNGVNSSGQSVAWVATIPAPGGLLAIGSIGLVSLRRRRVTASRCDDTFVM